MKYTYIIYVVQLTKRVIIILLNLALTIYVLGNLSCKIQLILWICLQPQNFNYRNLEVEKFLWVPLPHEN